MRAGSEQSARRLVRAEAARALLALHEAGALAEPGRWTWEALELLPTWCLLDGRRRRRLQLCAGAVLLGPEIRLWLERERLDAVAALIGPGALERVLREADALATALRPGGADARAGAGPGAGDPEEAVAAALAGPADPEALESRLLGAGAAVLLATLDERLPLGGLRESLGEPAGALPTPLGRALLAHAERVLAETEVADVTTGAATAEATGAGGVSATSAGARTAA